ncbi:hypothetical protein Tco_0736337, partial [Tanacetum coccineum]
TMHLRLWYPKGTGIETGVYDDSDHAGDYVDRKSTSGICTFVGCCLTSWFSKKHTALAISTTKAKYVSAEKACQQALWMKQALIDYDVYYGGNRRELEKTDYSINRHLEFRYKTEFQSHEPEVQEKKIKKIAELSMEPSKAARNGNCR